MKSLNYIAAIALMGCSLNTTETENQLEIVGPLVTHEDPEIEKCGPNEDIDKLIAIPSTGAFGTVIGGQRYYPSDKDIWVRAYGMTAAEKDQARYAASMADFWSPATRSYNVNSGSQASIHITDGGPVWPACDTNYTGGSDECWFAGTGCSASYATNVVGVRVCTDWTITLNLTSMYLYVDSRGLSRENIVLAVTIHEVGHALGLQHRAGPTIMNPGVPVPGSHSKPHWEDMYKFDACQIQALEDYQVDSSTEVIYLPEPEECE